MSLTGESEEREGTDTEILFRQESNMLYVSGFDQPGGSIVFATGEGIVQPTALTLPNRGEVNFTRAFLYRKSKLLLCFPCDTELSAPSGVAHTRESVHHLALCIPENQCTIWRCAYQRMSLFIRHPLSFFDPDFFLDVRNRRIPFGHCMALCR